MSPSAGFHIAFRAPTREAVVAFYDEALRAGGRDHGPPGLFLTPRIVPLGLECLRYEAVVWIVVTTGDYTLGDVWGPGSRLSAADARPRSPLPRR